MKDNFIEQPDGYLIIKSQQKHSETIIYNGLNYKITGIKKDYETRVYEHLYFSKEKFYMDKYNNLNIEHQLLQKGYNNLNERVSDLELVCNSLVAMALERPEQINYSLLSNFFDEGE